MRELETIQTKEEPMELWMYPIIAIELFYWFVWIPKNWRNNRECVEFVDAMKVVYGKQE